MCMLPITGIWDYGLWGHNDLQISSMASNVKFDFKIEIIDLNTLISICMLTKTDLYCDSLRGQGNLQMTSEATSHNGLGKLYYFDFNWNFQYVH